ncbi:MAG: MoaD/ThiS family protein [Zhaonellaceae bacterium]|jgi:molybdopterin synthase sulfur carrier subunit|nr:MoaD/ThiS family protein [Clostridia bacterium]
MKLEVHLFAGLFCNNEELDCFGETDFEMEVPENTTLNELVKLLNLELPYELIYMINGKRCDKSYCLKDKDRVGIFPPIGGG